MITPEQKAEYIRNNGMLCPFCGSEEIYTPSGGLLAVGGDAPEEDDQKQLGKMTACDDCGKKWEEIYTLTDLSEEVV